MSDNSKVGTFTITDADSQLKNSGTHVTHTTAGNTKKVWNFNWQAPVTDVGAIKFYVSAIAADGTGSTGGDQAMTTSSSDFSVLGI